MKSTLIKKEEYLIRSFETTSVGVNGRSVVDVMVLVPKVKRVTNIHEEHTLNVNIDLLDFTDIVHTPIVGAIFKVEMDEPFVPPHSTKLCTSIQIFVMCDETTKQPLSDPIQDAINIINAF